MRPSDSLALRPLAIGLFCAALFGCDDGDQLVPDPDAVAVGDTSACTPGAPCDDGDKCTQADQCHAAAGCKGTALVCQDGNPCTSDGCNPATGTCAHPVQGGLCDDGNDCTSGDACAAGACVSGPGKNCDDGNPCTQDACVPDTAACSHLPVAAPCQDGNACTKDDHCAAGACQGAPATCDDGNPCTSDGCDPKTGCTALPGAAACSDGTACTEGDSCTAGVCAGKAVACDDGNPCTADTCDKTGGCQHDAQGGACDDGNPCTQGDACQAKACVGGKNGCECTNDDACAKADDGDACNGILVCDKATSKCKVDAGTVIVCPAPSNDCLTVACKPATGKCVAKPLPDGAACDADGSQCSTQDTCDDGNCKLGKPLVCDDKNPCTADVCKAALGCVHTPAPGAPCNADDNACTVDDACEGKACVAGAAKTCNDGNPCTQDQCGTKTGSCGFDAKAFDGDACDADGSVCTVGDACSGSKCQKGKALPCDDGNTCTTDACDPATGCQHQASAGPCSDGNACTSGDVCQGGKCQPGEAKSCTDGDKCTADACNPDGGGCKFAKIDGCSSACTTDADCADGKPCTDDLCDSAKCINSANIAPCDDGSVCTTGEQCKDGACLAKVQKGCDDGNLCTNDACDPKVGCTYAANDATCDADGNACTQPDVCAAKACVAGKAKACDDGNACSVDACDKASGKCVHSGGKFDGDPCDADGSACTQNDACKDGACQKGKALACDDGNPCTTDTCLPQKGCTAAATPGPCDDGQGCTVSDACQDGNCKPGQKKACDDGLQCTTDACDSGTGKCAFAGIPGCGTFCAKDGDCDDKNGCTDDACKNGNCVFSPNSKPCPQVDKCLLSGTCSAGACKGAPSVDCDDANPCTDDACDPKSGLCVFTGNDGPCSDGNACTDGDGCKSGKCLTGKAKVCEDSDPCTDGTCDVKTGNCLFTPHSKACDDGSLCTWGEVCAGGKCAPTTIAPFDSQVGSGVPGFKDGAANVAQFSEPRGLARDGSAWYVADSGNHRIRHISATGVVTAVAGTGVGGKANGPAAQASFQAPKGVVVLDGVLYVADSGNHAIRRIDKGVVSTLAGNPGAAGFKDGAGNAALFTEPVALATDGAVLYVTDAGNHAVRIVGLDGAVVTLAGTGKPGFQNGAGKQAQFNQPAGITVGPTSDVYVADTLNHRIRKLTAAGVVSTAAGTGNGGYVDGAAAQAGFFFPVGVALAPGGDLVIADRQNNVLRALSPAGEVRLYAGDGTPAVLKEPFAVVFDGAGAAWVVEGSQHRLRRLRVPVTICDDGNVCTTEACDAKSGSCVPTAKADDTPCSDGCTQFQKCQSGACTGGVLKPCNDNNPCTNDFCASGVCKSMASATCK